MSGRAAQTKGTNRCACQMGLSEEELEVGGGEGAELAGRRPPCTPTWVLLSCQGPAAD